MKILGYEISKSHKAADKAVQVVPSTLETKPSIPLKSSFPRAEIGDSGTRGLSGIITEEYNPKLQGVQGVRIYDQMRKSDGTVRAAVMACTLPIRRAKWFVNPATQDQKDIDIAEFVEHALFDFLEDMTWDDVIRQALNSVSLGVMVFEKVYGVKDHLGKSYVTLKKLAPRMPTSIQKWELSDRTFGIQQIRQDGVMAEIPGSKLLIFINDREGDNYWGNSALRAAYKHWYFKDNFYKIDAIAFERQGLGVPKIKMPIGYTESDERKAVQAMANLRANENAYLVLPNGYEAEFMNMGSSTTRDPEKSINHHNKEILQSVLAQFLELGQTSSGGSRALSQDHSDLFLKAVESIANNIVAEVNKKLIPELVDLNFSDVTVYPVMDYSGITKVDMEAVANAYGALVTAGALKPTVDDQQYFRAMLGLPAISQQQIDEQDPSSEDLKDGVDVDAEAEDDTMPDENKVVDNATDKSKKPDPTKKDNKKVDEASKNKKEVASVHTHHKLKRTFDDGKGFKSWRPLTFAEQKVSFSNIENTMNSLEDTFTSAAKDLLKGAKDGFMSKLQTLLENGDTKGIQDLEIKFIADYKSLLKDTMRKAYEYGKNNVSTEIGVSVPPNSADSLANIDLMADTIANKTASDIETRAKLATANARKSDVSTIQSAGTIDAAIDDVIDSSVINTRGVIVSQSINNGRNDVFQRNEDMIYALQRSEVLDDTTCNFCLSMDGRVIDMGDDWANTETFHSNCRGMWVAILKDEQDPPEIGGIPQNVGDYYGGEPNSLVQPRSPITLPGTMAHDYAQEMKKK